MDPYKHERFRRREAVAEELDQVINRVGVLYGELTTINAAIAGNRKFDKVETDRRVRARLMSVAPIFGLPKDHHLAGSIADQVRKDHAELREKGA
jgi:hypothetical protein